MSKPGQQQRRGPPATRLAPAVQGFPINHAVLQRAFQKLSSIVPAAEGAGSPGNAAKVSDGEGEGEGEGGTAETRKRVAGPETPPSKAWAQRPGQLARCY